MKGDEIPCDQAINSLLSIYSKVLKSVFIVIHDFNQGGLEFGADMNVQNSGFVMALTKHELTIHSMFFAIHDLLAQWFQRKEGP